MNKYLMYICQEEIAIQNINDFIYPFETSVEEENEMGLSFFTIEQEEICTIHPISLNDPLMGNMFVVHTSDEKVWAKKEDGKEYFESFEFGAPAEYREDCMFNEEEVIELTNHILFKAELSSGYAVKSWEDCDKRLQDM
jgi:hypothetical protein